MPITMALGNIFTYKGPNNNMFWTFKKKKSLILLSRIRFPSTAIMLSKSNFIVTLIQVSIFPCTSWYLGSVFGAPLGTLSASSSEFSGALLLWYS